MKRSDTLAKRTANSPRKKPTAISPASLLRRTLGTAPTRYHSQLGDTVLWAATWALMVTAAYYGLSILAWPASPRANSLM